MDFPLVISLRKYFGYVYLLQLYYLEDYQAPPQRSLIFSIRHLLAKDDLIRYAVFEQI